MTNELRDKKNISILIAVRLLYALGLQTANKISVGRRSTPYVNSLGGFSCQARSFMQPTVNQPGWIVSMTQRFKCSFIARRISHSPRNARCSSFSWLRELVWETFLFSHRVPVPGTLTNCDTERHRRVFYAWKLDSSLFSRYYLASRRRKFLILL